VIAMPCQWIVSHLEEVPVRCGDDYYANLSIDFPVCASHWEFHMLHRGEV
jgi:hypothetical protein